MCLAQHLAVLNICTTALAPSRHMVGIHFLQLPNALTVGIMADGAVWTVACSLGFGLVGLPLINLAHGGLVEQPDIQQLCFLTATKHILKDASAVSYKVIVHQFVNLCRKLRVIQRQMMEAPKCL